jgi:hypothetical protein
MCGDHPRPAAFSAGLLFVFISGLAGVTDAGLFLRASPSVEHKPQAKSLLVCRLANECLDYSDSDAHTQYIGNQTFEGATSLYLDLNYAGKYNGSADRPATNVCMRGRLAPTFFLLGAQKSATTNFASRFSQVALSVVPPKPKDSEPGYFQKELHMFDSQKRAIGVGMDGWLKYYPRCSNQVHAVGMDATPSYISSAIAPSIMRQWFGTQHSGKLHFLVLLRSPLFRMRSSFYHAKEHRGCKRNQNLCGSFAKYISTALAAYRLGCPSGEFFATVKGLKECQNADGVEQGGPGDPFHLSLYVPQLQRWTSIFDAQQFVVCPFLLYVSPSILVPRLVDFMAKRIGSPIKSFAYTGAIPRGTKDAGKAHRYPPLQKDIDALSKKDLDDFGHVIETEAGPAALAKLLAPKMEQGLVLFGYTGPSNNETRINLYIQQNW